MKAFDETYADHDFKRQIADAKSGWMADVPRQAEPDLYVAGLSGSLIARILRVFSRGTR